MLKKTSHSFFSKSCINCLNKNQCISAGAYWQCKRAYFLRLRGYEQEANEAMKKGKIMHEIEQKGMPTIDDLSLETFYKEIYSGKEVVISELPVCNCLHGLKGVIDIIKFRYDLKTNTLNIHIIELKSNFNKKYIQQLTAYALIFSNKNCLIGYLDKEKRYMNKFYRDKDKDLNVNISLELKIINGHSYKQDFMKNNVLTEWGEVMSIVLCQGKKPFKHFHKAGIYFLSEIPLSKSCKRDENSCSYWSICKKHEPNCHKTRQRYFGKKSIVIKTKPKIL